MACTLKSPQMDQFITNNYNSTHYLHFPQPVDFLAVCLHHFFQALDGALGEALGGALGRALGGCNLFSSSWLQKKGYIRLYTV